MKKRAFFIFTLLLIFVLLLQNTFAQDSSQWHLPDGAIARLGKGSIIDISIFARWQDTRQWELG